MKIRLNAKKPYHAPSYRSSPIAALVHYTGLPRPTACKLSDSDLRAVFRHREHQPKFLANGDIVDEFYAMVHTPIAMKDACKIPNALKAVNKEWDKLANLPAWDLSSVRERADVEAESKATGKPVHFGSLMDLCHQKHSELIGTSEEWKVDYKGRVVFRGDRVKDEYGHLAVFTDQSATASHMAAAKFVDTYARFPGNAGEDSDARSAYTQVPFEELATLHIDHTETWISLPKNRQPKEWAHMHNPVCLLTRNLYGHPIAGLIWEKFCQRSIFAAGFERIPGWECLFVHKAKKLFLPVYVDDLRMAGPQNELAPMWETLGMTLDLDPAAPSDTNTYLGCNQKDIATPTSLMAEKNELVNRLLGRVGHGLTKEIADQEKPLHDT